MPNKIGRFEILNEITHSEIGSVYKASDPESGQTVALKTIRLELLGDQAAALIKLILEEGESTKPLNSPNIALLYGAGELEGVFCAAMEYVQGNSIGTMLARKEGFSIWDLQDVARQTSQALDHARGHNVVHYSLEPSKIMVQWDGMVKMLGFGVSTMGAYAAQASGVPPEVLHYMSPEQLRGDPLDARSNLFSLGSILYEMVTERKAFQGEDAEQVRLAIQESTPVAPDQVNRKIHPALSDVIMKAIAKDPDARYQTGQELVSDLEKSKETPKASTKKAPAATVAPPQGLNVARKAETPAALPPPIKIVVPKVIIAKPAPLPVVEPKIAEPKIAAAEQAPLSAATDDAKANFNSHNQYDEPEEKHAVKEETHAIKEDAKEESPKRTWPAPTAGFPALPSLNSSSDELSVMPAQPANSDNGSHGGEVSAIALDMQQPEPEAAPRNTRSIAAAVGYGASAASVEELPRTPKLASSEQFISSVVKASVDALSKPPAATASIAAEPEVKPKPRVAVDPMMDESRKAPSEPRRSFSEITELPPLKEAYVAPPPPPPAETAAQGVPPPHSLFADSEPEKPKLQVKEAARAAVSEIRKTPPKLFMYSIAGAVFIMLLVIVAIAFHIHSENSDDDSAPIKPAATTQTAPANSTNPASQPAQPLAVTPVEPAPVEAPPIQSSAAESARVSVTPKAKKEKKAKPVAVASAPAAIPGQLSVSSSPEGAQVRIDGREDAGWVTPFNLAGLTPGQHSVTVSKAGYSTETRSIEVGSGSKSAMAVQLAALTSSVSIASDPQGASIVMDGKDTGKVTPSLITVDKPGNHQFILRKNGYLEESTAANLQVGQTFHFSPTLRALGATSDIKLGGKFKKLFGGSDTAGMGSVVARTNPKGAQVAVNGRVLDKLSPVEFFLNPGNYEVDITLTGYKPVHRVINVDKAGKVVVDETLDRQ